MPNTGPGTSHRHKTKTGYWYDLTDLASGDDHNHPFEETRHPADAFTDGEVIALKALLVQPSPTPTPTPEPVPSPPAPAPSVIAMPSVTPTTDGARFEWTVNPSAQGWIEYGAGLSKSTAVETGYLDRHIQTITGESGTVPYRIAARNQVGVTSYYTGSFTTVASPTPTPPPPTPPPSGIVRPPIKTGTIIKRAEPATSRPGFKQEITDPTFGTKILRISDKHLYRNFYPTQASFSMNNDRLIFFPGNGLRMLRTSDWTDIGAMASGTDHCQWSNKDNNLLWGVAESPPEVRKHNGQPYEAGGRWITHRKFDGYVWASLGMGDGNLADDDKMAIALRRADGQNRVIGYDPYADRILGYVDVPEQPFGVQISIDGKYLHISRGNYRGDWIYHLPGADQACPPVSGGRYSTPGLLSSGQSHAVMAKLEDGTAVWVTYAAGLWTHRLSDNERWPVLPNNQNRTPTECAYTSPWGGHVSFSNRAFPGWVTLSSGTAQPGRPCHDMIVAAAIDGSGKYMEVAHAQACALLPDGTGVPYESTPFAISDRDLKWWVWGSQWRGNGTNTPGNETFCYMARVAA